MLVTASAVDHGDRRWLVCNDDNVTPSSAPINVHMNKSGVTIYYIIVRWLGIVRVKTPSL